MVDLTNATEMLYSLRSIDEEVKKDLEVLDQLKSLVINLSVSTDKEAIQSSGSKDKLGAIMAKIVDLEKELNAKTDGLANRREMAKEIIFRIENEKYQNILYDYFILNMPFWKVVDSYELIYNTARYQLKKAIKEYERVYDNTRCLKNQHIVKISKINA